jgi:hypothetical protein
MSSFSLDMNKKLWADENIFNDYFAVVLKLNKTVIDQDWDASKFRYYANQLDSIMQQYENEHDGIKDPLFYWSFATANALFLLIGRKYDELGAARVRYVINGYREGLYKHETYPSYPKIYIDKAFEHMMPFAEGDDADWIEENRNNFLPIQEQAYS